MLDLLLLGAIAIAAIIVMIIFLPNGVAELVSTLLGVFIGVRAERMLGSQSERAEAKKARDHLLRELTDNLLVVESIANRREDFPALVDSLLSLKTGLWSVLSGGGRLPAILGSDLLRALDKAYGILEDLRLIAHLFFQDSKWVSLQSGRGLESEFDTLRKARANEAVPAIQDAIYMLVKQGATLPDCRAPQCEQV